jgi:hypothetical protein
VQQAGTDSFAYRYLRAATAMEPHFGALSPVKLKVQSDVQAGVGLPTPLADSDLDVVGNENAGLGVMRALCDDVAIKIEE